MGAATAWAATRRGLSVTVLEQFTPGHQLGSSHGSARIARRAYGDLLYAKLSGRAFDLWRELEVDADVSVLRMLGGLDFGARRDASVIAALLAEVGAEHEVLDAAEAQRRWPGMRFAGSVVYHPQAGTLDADAATAAFLSAAVRRGARVSHDTAVASVRPASAAVDVALADGSRLSAAVVVVAAGAWVARLLDGLVELPQARVTQQQVFHFPRLDPSAPPWPSAEPALPR